MARVHSGVLLFLALSAFGSRPALAQPVFSAFTQNVPTIDGVIEIGEWGDAAIMNFSLDYCMESHLCTIFVKNDGVALYVAVRVRDEEYSGAPGADVLSLDFDNDNDGALAPGDNVWQIRFDGINADAFNPSGMIGADQPDVTDGGTDELLAAITHTNPVPLGLGDYDVEYRAPLDTADDLHDFSLGPGSVVGFSFHLDDGDLPGGCQPGLATRWPSTGPGMWADIVIAGPPVCPQVMNLSCESDCSAQVITGSWTNPVPYDGIEVEIVSPGGVPVFSQTLPGSATTLSAAGIAPGPYVVRVTGVCPAGPSVTAVCGVAHNPFVTGTTNVVWNPEPDGGDTQSGDELVGLLQGLGKQIVVIEDDLTDYPCLTQLDSGTVLWITLGTFPDNRALTPMEGQRIVDVLLQGASIYIEGSDIWGFDPLTPFANYDGVLGTVMDGNVIENGDDSHTCLTGLAHADLDLTGFDAPYDQDQAGNDSTDRLLPTGAPGFTPDALGTNAGPVWMDCNEGYFTAIYYVPDVDPLGSDPGKVLSKSDEIGGYCGDKGETLIPIVNRLKGLPDFFSRGDCNGDGMESLADALALLLFLFLSGPEPPCLDACDLVDDDNLVLADVVALLTYLFVPGSPPPDPPHPGCGSDPGGDDLDCETPPSCD